MQTHKESRSHRPRRTNRRPHVSVVDLEPEEAAPLAETAVEPLEVDAQPAEAGEEPDEFAPDVRDTGELYGVHVAPAADRLRVTPEDGELFAGAALGESWREALEVAAAEGGPEPEREVIILDDTDLERGHDSTDFRDRPKADRGSGGRGGL